MQKLAASRAFANQSVRFILILVISWLLAGSGIFNVKDASDAALRDVFYRATAFNYPAQKSPKITVLLINDRSLPPGGVWPTSYGVHATALLALARYKPSAIFVEMSFLQNMPDHEGLTALIDVLRSLKRVGTSVYLPIATPTPNAPWLIRPELAQLAKEGTIQLVSVGDIPLQARSLNYQLIPSRTGFPSTAKALYDDYCARLPQQTCKVPNDRPFFEIWWGGRKSASDCVTPQTGSCPQLSQSVVVRFRNLVWDSLLDYSSTLRSLEANPLPRPYHPFTDIDDLRNGRTPPEVLELIRGGTVFYGVNLDMLRAATYTAVYGATESYELPSIFRHAMAFDNLVALQDAIVRPDPPYAVSSQVYVFFLILACIAAMFFVRALLTFVGITRGLWAADWFAYSLTAFAVVYLSHTVFHTSPTNWLGVFTFSIPLLIIDTTKLAETILGWAHWLFALLSGRRNPAS